MGSPGERESRIIAAWEQNAGSWERAVRSHALESRRLATDRAILDEVLACAGQRILDVGCGEGWLARALADAGRDVVGFDASNRLIESAAGLGGAQFRTLTYEDIEREPLVLGAFDVAVCNFSLLAERTGPLLTALRSTVPAGWLVIQTLHPLALMDGRYEDGWREESFAGMPGEWQPMPWYFRTVGSWTDEVVGSGWRIERIREPLHPASGQPLSLIITSRAQA